jgi:hypothetical protein
MLLHNQGLYGVTMAKSMKTGFELECEKKFDALVAWAVLNPDKTHGLAASDFSELRENFCRIATTIKASSAEPEPSEGGAQYVNVSPAPWP